MTDRTITTLFAAAMAAIVALVASIPPTMVAFSTLQQSRENKAITEAAARDAKVTASVIKQKTDETARDAKAVAEIIIAKTDEIHSVTNSNLTKMTKALAEANERIVQLEKLVTRLIESSRQKPEPAP